MNVAVIINPVSGRAARDGEARVALTRRALADAGIQAEVALTERAGHARELAGRFVSGGATLVVAWGGDGTVNEVASALAYRDCALAIVPGGSGNGLARNVGFEARPAAALRQALEGTERLIDAGELAGRIFVNVAGIGFDARVARVFNGRPRGQRGLWPYVWLSLREVWRYAPARYRISLDDETIEAEALAVIFANGTEFGNGFRIAPRAQLDDGRLDALVADARGVLRQFWRARHFLTGSLERAEGVLCRTVTTVTVEAAGLMECQVDGEAFIAGPRVLARILPGAIRLRVPRC